MPKPDEQLSEFPTHITTLDWDRANQLHITKFKETLDTLLDNVSVPTDALTCNNFHCSTHANTLLSFFNEVSCAITKAGRASIPHKRVGKRKVMPGWNEYVAEYKDKSIFWNFLWKEAGCPRVGWVAVTRRKARTDYHKAIKEVKRNRDAIVRSTIAGIISNKKFCYFWNKIKKLKGVKRSSTNVMDNASGSNEICELFKSKYGALYSSPKYDCTELKRKTSAGHYKQMHQ